MAEKFPPLPSPSGDKPHTVTVRFSDTQLNFIETLAQRLHLRTDGRVNRSRALQALVDYASTRLGTDWATFALPGGAA